MTLNIRWDASDTVYISGPPSERYVHWPLEMSSNTSTSCNISVWLLDSAGNEIVSQNYDGVPIHPEFTKFSPAILVSESYFGSPETWTLRALISTSGVPIEIPRVITKSIENTGVSGGGKNPLLLILGIGLLALALGGKRLLR